MFGSERDHPVVFPEGPAQPRSDGIPWNKGLERGQESGASESTITVSSDKGAGEEVVAGSSRPLPTKTGEVEPDLAKRPRVSGPFREGFAEPRGASGGHTKYSRDAGGFTESGTQSDSPSECGVSALA